MPSNFQKEGWNIIMPHRFIVFESHNKINYFVMRRGFKIDELEILFVE